MYEHIEDEGPSLTEKVIIGAIIILGFIAGVFYFNKPTEQVNSKITLYSANGSPIQEWVSYGPVTSQGTGYRFLNEEDRAEIRVSGSVIVEEVQE